jgi:hypothetical protein
MNIRRLIRKDREQRPVPPVQMDRLKQADRTALINDGFYGLNHEEKIPAVG